MKEHGKYQALVDAAEHFVHKVDCGLADRFALTESYEQFKAGLWDATNPKSQTVMPKITSEFVNGDWERIYFDNDIVIEGHSVTARQLMEILETVCGITIEFDEVEEDI